MYKIQKIPGRTVEIDGLEYLWFGGTSYLGIPHNIDFHQLILEGLQKYGSNWGSSRNNPLQIDIYDIFEAQLASFVGAEGALSVSSGMLAGQLVVKFLETELPNCHTIYAPKVHPALLGKAYATNNQNFIDFSEGINSQINESKADNFIICTDSVSSPTIENFDFYWVKSLPTNKQINLIIDDSHSLGILGENGRGIYSQIEHNSNVNFIVVSSLNKALGVTGGAIFSKKEMIEKLKRIPSFTASSPISPALAFACKNALVIYQNELKILKENILYFNSLIQKLIGISHLQNHPTYSFQKNGIIDFLAGHRVLVPNFAYPLPSSVPVNRLVISSLHTFDDLKKLADLIKQFYESES